MELLVNHLFFLLEQDGLHQLRNEFPSKSGSLVSECTFVCHSHTIALHCLTDCPGCFLRARRSRLWKRQRDCDSSTRKTIRIISTSHGDGRAWSRVRVNWTRELRRSIIPRIKCTRRKREWEGCTINRSMVVSYARSTVLLIGLYHISGRPTLIFFIADADIYKSWWPI